MEVVRTIKPGQPGTRRFQKHWGDNLVAVRTSAKNNRARWSADHKVWLMPSGTAVALGVSGRVIEGLAERCNDVEMYDG